jgi:hypothetical protein
MSFPGKHVCMVELAGFPSPTSPGAQIDIKEAQKIVAYTSKNASKFIDPVQSPIGTLFPLCYNTTYALNRQANAFELQ